MELLNMRTRPVTRIQFSNLNSKNIWEEKIRIGNKLYPNLEFLTVKHDVRKCMIAHDINPNSLDHKMRELSKQGLMLVPLKKELLRGDFSHVVTRYEGKGQYVYRAVITKSMKDAEEFIHADQIGDDIKIGELLGFPKKSIKFFDDIWKKGYFDPIWQQADNSPDNILKFKKETKDQYGNLEKKIVRLKQNDEYYKTLATFRYIGIRILSHFPSSFGEDESVEVANNWIQLAEDLKLEGLEETLDILRLPFEWDCYKGYAEINTPVFKIITDSMPCYPHHVVQQESDYYPEEAPKGLKFPWKNPLFS